MQSIDSKMVKLHVLCNRCNSAATQPFDRAWDELLAYLRECGHVLKTGSVIRFYRLFGYNARRKTLNLHLYAVKLFGCVAAEFSIPLDITGMANAIKRQQPYSNIYIGLGRRNWMKSLVLAGPSDVSACLDADGKCVFAVWFLAIGEWEFQFIYATPGQKRDGMTDTWHRTQSRHIRLKEFGTKDD